MIIGGAETKKSGKEPSGVKDGSDGAGYYFDEGNQGNGMATTTTTAV